MTKKFDKVIKDEFAWWEGGISEKELDRLQELAKSAENIAKVGKENKEDLSYRKTKIKWLYPSEENSEIYAILADVLTGLNDKYFGFDLAGFSETLQLGNYCAEEKGEYKWHIDRTFAGQPRKLSIMLQLSDPSEYEGGDLIIKVGEKEEIMKKKRGTVIAFPSWTLHKVTPVTKGSRQSLVGWATGPEFK